MGYFFSIGVVRGNQYFDNSAVVSSADFTEEELEKLYNGEEIVDKEGDIIYLCENEEEEEC